LHLILFVFFNELSHSDSLSHIRHFICFILDASINSVNCQSAVLHIINKVNVMSTLMQQPDSEGQRVVAGKRLGSPHQMWDNREKDFFRRRDLHGQRPLCSFRQSSHIRQRTEVYAPKFFIYIWDADMLDNGFVCMLC